MGAPVAARRRALILAGALAAGPLARHAQAAADRSAERSPLAPTPRQSRGPFYPLDPPERQITDLILERDGRRGAGEAVELGGRVLDTSGRPVPNAMVEIWQCDAHGRYHHPGDRGPAPPDPLFTGYGRTTSAADGSYRFRTIRPVPYPGRTPHIHFAVSDEMRSLLLVTQLYVRGEPSNEHDGLFRSLPQQQRELLLADFAAPAPGRIAKPRFDLVVAS